VHRSRSGNRPFRGKMLKNIFLVLFILISLDAVACWRIDGTFAIDGETFKINHKIDDGKDYSFPFKTFILSLNLRTEKDQSKTLVYKIQEKKGISLFLVSEGEEEAIKVGESKDVYAKGKEGQPNSIITVRFKDI
jgi:hypothetical protein